jgi:hypothetical protein
LVEGFLSKAAATWTHLGCNENTFVLKARFMDCKKNFGDKAEKFTSER